MCTCVCQLVASVRMLWLCDDMSDDCVHVHPSCRLAGALDYMGPSKDSEDFKEGYHAACECLKGAQELLGPCDHTVTAMCMTYLGFFMKALVRVCVCRRLRLASEGGGRMGGGPMGLRLGRKGPRETGGAGGVSAYVCRSHVAGAKGGICRPVGAVSQVIST